MNIKLVNNNINLTKTEFNYLPAEKNGDKVSRKVGKVSFHFFNTHLASLGIKSLLALVFSAALLTATFLTTAIPLAIPAVIIGGISIILLIQVLRSRKELLFEISLLHTVKAGGQEWCTPITNNIVLGALPLEHHKDMLQKLIVSKVLTMVEEFERKPGLVRSLSKQDLETIQIENKEIPSADFIGVSPENIHEGVEYVREAISKNDVVYIHCKAGRGRSATIVVSYLLKYGHEGQTFPDFKAAYQFVKAKRPLINLNKRQQAAVEQYQQKYINI